MTNAKVNSESFPDLASLLVGYGFLGLQPIFVRLLSLAGVGTAESVIARFAFGGVLIVAICLARGRWLSTSQPKMLLLRGVLGGMAVLLYFYSVREAGAARATLLNYTYPLWANVFARLEGKRVHSSFWFLLVVASVGVGLLLLEEDGSQGAIGAGEVAGLLSGLTAGASVLTLKRLRDTDESLTILASFTVVGILMSLPFLEFDEKLPEPSPRLAILLAGVGATSFFGHMFFTRGYRGVPLATGSALALLVPTLSTLLSAYWLGEPLSRYAMLGATLVLGALGIVPFVTGANERANGFAPHSAAALRTGDSPGESSGDDETEGRAP